MLEKAIAANANEGVVDYDFGQLHRLQLVGALRWLLQKIPFYEDEVMWRSTFADAKLANVVRALDKACLGKLESADSIDSLAEMILISRHWFELGVAKENLFNYHLISKLVHLTRPLTKLEMLHLMFILNLQRYISSQDRDIVTNKVVTALSNPEVMLNIDELSIISMGFFKTKTKMPFNLLDKFLPRFGENLRLAESSALIESMSVVSCLKAIRFSLETTNFDVHTFRDQIKQIANHISNNDHLLQSNICLAHLIVVLNSARLQHERRTFKLVFERLVTQRESFRIKDIERVLFCLSNSMFKCPANKMKIIEDYLHTCPETTIYSYHIYNIILFMSTMNYYPSKLVELAMDPNFLANSKEISKMDISNTLLLLDTILRLEKNKKLLSNEQIEEARSKLPYNLEFNNTNKSRILRTFNDSLAASKYAQRFGMFYLFPFAAFPVPIIFSKKDGADKLRQLNDLRRSSDRDNSNQVFEHYYPYQPELVRPNQLQGGRAILLLTARDFSHSSNIRGATQLYKRLLHDMGLRVIEIHLRDLGELRWPQYADSKDSWAQPEVIDCIKAARKLYI